jgi:hypothetical protein
LKLCHWTLFRHWSSVIRHFPPVPAFAVVFRSEHLQQSATHADEKFFRRKLNSPILRRDAFLCGDF